MQPGMLLRLLRKLTVDVSVITEYTTVALRVRFFLILLKSSPTYFWNLRELYVKAIVIFM